MGSKKRKRLGNAISFSKISEVTFGSFPVSRPF